MPNPGYVQPRKWTPLRRELERLLADGHWHAEEQLRCRLLHLVDPRIAVRLWVREYDGHTRRRGGERPAGARLVATSTDWHQRALLSGARKVFLNQLLTMEKDGRLECWRKGRERYWRLRCERA